MLVEKVKILCVLSLGVFFYPDSVESTCRCKNKINDYCCESASNSKDACCHVDGFDKNPPIWVDSTSSNPTTIGPTIPVEDPTTPIPTTTSDNTTTPTPITANDEECAKNISAHAQCISPFRKMMLDEVLKDVPEKCNQISWLKLLKKIKEDCKPHLVLPAQCATNFNIKGECRNGFEKMVKMLGEMEEVCQDWAIKNLQGDIAELEKFKCIIEDGGERLGTIGCWWCGCICPDCFCPML